MSTSQGLKQHHGEMKKKREEVLPTIELETTWKKEM
jgi:hypothetical protein